MSMIYVIIKNDDLI